MIDEKQTIMDKTKEKKAVVHRKNDDKNRHLTLQPRLWRLLWQIVDLVKILLGQEFQLHRRCDLEIINLRHFKWLNVSTNVNCESI